MAITFNPIIMQGVVYWHTGLWECSYPSCLFTCQLRDLSRNFPRRTPPNSSFLAKSLPPGVPSVIVLEKIGQSRRWHQTLWHQPVSCNNCFNSLHLQRAHRTDSQKPISTVMRVCHLYSIYVDNTGCLGIISPIFLLVFLLVSLIKIRKFEKIN